MLQRCPAHVGDAFAAVAGQACDPSAQEAKAWIAAFIALLEQELQAEADAEQGTILLTPAQQVGHQPGGPEVGHGRVKGADPRKDQRIDALQIIGAMDQRAALIEPLEAFLHLSLIHI